MNRRIARSSLVMIAACALAVPQATWAQTPDRASPVAPAPAAPATPSAADVEQARIHFERGLQLYREESLGPALYELERAYELAPSYRILYNIALIHRQQNNYAAALDTFRRFLREGGSDVSEERRNDVAHDIATLASRVATIAIVVNVAGAEVTIDDVPACTTAQKTCPSPLPGPVSVNPGPRKITAQKSGYLPATKTVRVVGADAVSISLELSPLPAKEQPTERVSDMGARNNAAIAWSATGALGIGAVVTGILAINAKSKLTSDANTFGVSSADLDSDDKKVKRFALASDILGGAAVAGAAVSVYFTVKAIQANKENEPASAPKSGSGFTFGVGPGSVSMRASF